MRSDRYAALLDDLVDAARDPFGLSHQGSRRARKVAPGLARRPWKRLCKAIRKLGDDPADTDLHRVRRRAKQARYALEAVAPVHGSRASKLAGRAADIQGTLGDHQDRVVARGWLAESAADVDDAGATFVAGELAGLLAAEQRELRRRARRECRMVCRSRFPA
jgi:CHAD domain-containing protein